MPSSVSRAACIAGGAWTTTSIGAFTGIDVPFNFFTFSLFAFQFSLVACRSGAATNSYRQGTGIGFLLLNVLVAAALQLERITLAPSLACSLADDVIFNIMTSRSLFIAQPAW